MNKLFAVFKREYFQAVRKKMFIIMTILFPVLMAAAFLLPGLLMVKGMGTKKVAVIDGTGRLADAYGKKDAAAPAEAPADKDKPLADRRKNNLPMNMEVDYIDAKGADVETIAKPYLGHLTTDDKKARIDGVFVIPANAVDTGDKPMKFYSRSSTDFMTQERLSRQANRAIQRMRLTSRGLDPNELEKLMGDVDVDAVQLSKSGEEKKGGEANFIVGFLLTALVILPAFIYGLEIMRGIIQEKTDRVVEVLVSSMTSKQLLIGKITGIAAVGLTQVSVWLLMASLVAGFGAASAAAAGFNVASVLRPSLFIYFVIFFVLAYLTYVCIYAIAGAVCNSEKEAQQMIAPISMIMMLPWFLLVVIITNPDSTVSVALSLSPVFGPITMFVRTFVSDPPMWHVLLSIAISIATISVFFWATAKIFRVGILSYGKRPTLPELWRWLKIA